MDAGSHARSPQANPPQGYISLTYASSAGQKSAVLLSHGRILGLLCGSVFLGGWFIVSSLGTMALVFSPAVRQFVFSSFLGLPAASQVGTVIESKAGVVATEQGTGDRLEAEAPLAPLEKLPTLAKTPAAVAPVKKVASAPGEEIQPKAGVMAAPEVTRFDRTQVEVSSGKLEFRFFLNLLQKGKKQTGRILARAQFRTKEGKILNVASTLEGGSVFQQGADPEMGIPFTMRHAVRHDLVFLAPEEIEGKFISVTARAYPDGKGAMSSVSIPAL